MAASHSKSDAWLGYAREVVELVARGRNTKEAGPVPTESCAHGGVFVTLHHSGRLRGCMGTLDPSQPLADAVHHAAICAASQDPRFLPVTPAELPELRIEISILSAPEPMGSLDDLEIGQHGIIVQRGASRGLFLPQVATEHHFDKETFLTRCCTEKAGLPADAWRDPDTEVLLFTAEVLREM